MKLTTGIACVALLSVLSAVLSLGTPSILHFDDTPGFALVDTTNAIPLIIDHTESEAVKIAGRNFADDLHKVTGHRPKVLPCLPSNTSTAIIAGIVDSPLIRRINHHQHRQYETGGANSQVVLQHDELRGKWESYDIRVVSHALPGLDEALVITGSDKRGVIYALYTLSESIGVSPFHWWSDIPPHHHTNITFPREGVLAHGEPTVKYRGFFINDEQPTLWNWAKEHYGTGEAPFQVGMYERLFELLLRLKGNYMWPAMWESKFAVDGLDTLPEQPVPGPNQILAHQMGVVMGTSHHEPMSRNQKEYTDHGTGAWSWLQNRDFLTGWWKYGVERAKGLDTVFTVGMRGDGDLELPEATVEILQDIVSTQQHILREGLNQTGLDAVPQTWAMYKEVMKFFADGLEVPPDVTPLLSDDNWGNLMAVMPNGSHQAGGGVYYHADYVGDPRNYKWINTVSLSKMWEQLNIAQSLDTKTIWILNVGDLKFLEQPLEYFMSLSYDFDRWGHDSLLEWYAEWAERDCGITGTGEKAEVGEIMALYSMYASRRKAELVDVETFSLVNYDEANRVLSQWSDLEMRAIKVLNKVEETRQLGFYEAVLLPIKLQHNLNKLYISAAKSNLYATQGRTAANVFADRARECFEIDHELTEAFHGVKNGKWSHMLAQPHFNYQYWQSPVRESLPPISYVSPNRPSYDHGNIVHTRYTLSNSKGAWPGDGKYNCEKGYACPNPSLLPLDPWGGKRWVEVGSGGPNDVEFAVETSHKWLVVSPDHGKITGDGKNDARVTVEVDWEMLSHSLDGALHGNLTAMDDSSEDAGSNTRKLEGWLIIRSSDGSKLNLTVPVILPPSPPDSFHGAVEGDGYVAIEAIHHQASSSGYSSGNDREGYTWTEIPFYGRTHSGMTVLPVSRHRFEVGQGPSLTYNFWTHSSNNATLELVLGPSLNFDGVSAFGVGVDDNEPQVVEPIPISTPGSLPPDWGEVVSNEARVVHLELGVLTGGEHSIVVWGMTPGIVLERIVVDLGGVRERGYSYLGPLESVLV